MAEQVPHNAPARTTLAANITSSALSLTLTSAANFGTNGRRRLMLWTEDGSGQVIAYEYVYMASRSGTTVTIESGGRGVEGSTAAAWNAATPTYVAEVLTEGALIALFAERGFANPMTTQDDVIVGGASGAPGRLAKGTDGQVLTVDPTTHHLVWATPASPGMTNPMTTQDDIIIGGASGAPTRLAKGADSQVLTVDPTTHHLVWANSPSGFSNPMTTLGDIITGGSGGTPGRLGIGSSGQVLSVVSGAPAWATPSGGGGGGGSGLYDAYAHYRDERASGTNGGDYTTASTWQTRTLQTEKADPQGIGSIASNKITLGAGTYHVEARATTQFTGVARLRLRDVTNGVTLVLGDTGGDNAGGGGYTQNDSLSLSGRFTLSGTADLELQMWATASRATYGFGAAAGSGDVEVFASVELWREGSGGGGGSLPYSLVALDDSAYSWRNQGGASVSIVNGAVVVNGPSEASWTWRGRFKAIPSEPWTLTRHFAVHGPSGGEWGAGLLLTDGTKVIAFEYGNSGGTPYFRISRWNTLTGSFNSVQATPVLTMGVPKLLRIDNDGTNLVYGYSYDGAYYLPVLTEGKTAFMTITESGHGVGQSGSPGATHLSVFDVS